MTLLLSRLSVLFLPLFLFGCSSTPDIPPFSASGYLADRGVVRIWRKNSDHQSVHIRTLYTPFSGGEGEVTDYVWLEESLISIQRQVKGKQPDDVTLRFDQAGGLNFMQRQLAGRREAVSPDAVELYKFDAQRMRNLSDALLSGQVFLKQGHWLGNNLLESCEGQQVRPAFDADDVQMLTQQQRSVSAPLMVSWLDAPEGIQLLRISQQDDCSQQPTEDDM
ncbi:DUF1481 domain-containing protein [Pantoea sp. Bo_2]|uniref:DUF1481 domain-containing protein n=1 Tax=Candidatus Pantoea gossypiicola TaxID=2608008 RepID=A0AB34CE06_9GAMM|nr:MULTISPECIES: DUF1481 domain-containing protein [Pantoea]KAA5921522.1 DUF1481 domain-containing protein [Pantoea sp. VH_8]KAA5927996.1 DUF1481 domain-containing protein [Pantoea sp. VH_4]KAA5936968.1 DUF1481 domain-containing protein [Pantoea sp. VH_3]KAA5949041.1 DUF1481 domain-containing protein [Pantoea sp. VH_24]KAA5952884.1 DUF1481 domain-containing protein [Pantoea sp. VH_16]